MHYSALEDLWHRERRFSMWFVAFAVTCMAAAGWSFSACAQTTINTPDLTAGLLWEVTAPNGQRSTLFGTIHSEDTRVLALFAAQRDVFNQAKRVFLELDFGAPEMQGMTKAMFLPADKHLQSIVDKALFEKTAALMRGHGVGTVELNRMKPWTAMMILSMPRQETGQFLDKVIYDQARAAGMTIKGLEAVHEQLAVFDALPLADQIKLLQSTVELGDQMPSVLQDLVNAYVSKSLSRLEYLYRDYLRPHEEALAALVHQRLVSERNQRMFERMRPSLAQGENFIAVGALHLAGDQGLLALLLSNGFQVRRLD